jgi:creatinine amidohydrolase
VIRSNFFTLSRLLAAWCMAGGVFLRYPLFCLPGITKLDRKNPRRTILHTKLAILIVALYASMALSQAPSPAAQAESSQKGKISVHWEELTAADFRDGIARAQGTCLLPFGILEKHGPHLPLGTDLLNVRYVALNAAQQEYAIVFPEYYFGQIFEAKHQPGTVAYSRHVQLELLQETTDEMARNGCKKVIIVNGHGGNENLLPYFAQTQLERPHDYVVYVMTPSGSDDAEPLHKSNPATDMHAGERETSRTLISRPDLVHMDRATQESGADQARLKLPEGVYTGIWWYARFPNHYAGEGAAATRELGELETKREINGIVEAIRAVKADQESLRLQNQFYEQSKHPLDTPQ